MTDLQRAATRALACLDLTNLNDDCTAEDITALCKRAQTPFGPVAAVCIWPQFVAQAVRELTGTGIRVATVVNFPSGRDEAGVVREMVERAVLDGAHEIDMVIPYTDLMEGQGESIKPTVERVVEAADGRLVKAILETGMLEDPEMIRIAAEQAIEGGADFIKTSTGKVAVNATLQAAEVMLNVIAAQSKPIGFKPAGGVRSTEDAADYLELADRIMGPDWVSPMTFRFGASGVLAALIATLEGRDGVTSAGGY